jgi:dTDP-4-dehydrorhamnose reductase
MRVLVLGVSGMLGHRLAMVLAGRFEVAGVCRDLESLPALGLAPGDLAGGLDAMRPESVVPLIERFSPEAVVNCVGIVKQRPEAGQAVASITVNSLFPHVVQMACRAVGARLLHVSTDCVFSGATGGYTESDTPDATDLYGRSKLLGEVTGPRVVTLRTSMIGWQLGEPTGLVGWFEAHRRERLTGYASAYFSGLTTTALAEVIAGVLADHADLEGLWHVAAERIDKHSLLERLAVAMGWRVDLSPSDVPCIDRSLDNARFRAATDWGPPAWADMLAGLAAEHAWYAALRGG